MWGFRLAFADSRRCGTANWERDGSIRWVLIGELEGGGGRNEGRGNMAHFGEEIGPSSVDAVHEVVDFWRRVKRVREGYSGGLGRSHSR